MIKVFDKNQGCINTLLLTSKISVSKVQKSRSIMKSETRKLSCVKVHLLFNRSLYRRSPVVRQYSWKPHLEQAWHVEYGMHAPSYDQSSQSQVSQYQPALP